MIVGEVILSAGKQVNSYYSYMKEHPAYQQDYELQKTVIIPLFDKRYFKSLWYLFDIGKIDRKLFDEKRTLFWETLGFLLDFSNPKWGQMIPPKHEPDDSSSQPVNGASPQEMHNDI